MVKIKSFEHKKTKYFLRIFFPNAQFIMLAGSKMRRWNFCGKFVCYLMLYLEWRSNESKKKPGNDSRLF